MKSVKSFYAQLTGIFRIVIVFFLVCSFILFIWGTSVINKQLKENSKIELMLFAKNCDYIFDSMFRNSLNIRNFIEDNYKVSLRKNIRLDNRANLVEFIESQLSSTDSVAGIFVYDMKGKVFTRDGIFDEDTVYYAYYDVIGNDYEKWQGSIESLKGMNTGKINISKILDNSRSEKRTMQYQRYYEVGNQPLVIVYEIPLTSFLNGKYGNGNYGIMLPNSEIYFDSEPVRFDVNVAETDGDNNENILFTHNKSLYMMSHYYSNTHTCRYIYVQSYSTYFEYAIKYGGVFFFLTLIFFMLAAGFSMWSSKRTVEPLKLVMSEISPDNSSGQNEMINILNCLKENKQEIVKYKALIEQYNSKMQTVGIERILMNFITAPQKADLSEEYKLTFPYNNYFVVIFKSNKEITEKLKAETEGFFSELCGENGICYDVQIGSVLAGVINCDDKLCMEFPGKVIALRGYIEKEYGSSLEMAVSDKTTLLSGINERYNSCLEEMNVEEKHKITNHDILNTSESISADSMEILSMCIKLGQPDYALLVFDAILNSNIYYCVETKEGTAMLYTVLSRILMCHNDTVSQLLLNFEKCQKSTEMIDYIKHIISGISKEYVETKINKKILLQLSVLKYINENLGDLTLSVASIADQFEMTPSYLSKQFKALFDISLLEYIQKARTNEAARMLLYSELLVNEISNKLGFVNTNVFIRLFKKFVGMTPGSFRNTRS